MSHIKKLEKLLKEEVIIEVQANIEELEKENSKKKNQGIQDDLKYMQDVKAYFEEAILNIENGSMTEEIAQELLQDLEDMQSDNDDV